jgi:hypothetical protein
VQWLTFAGGLVIGALTIVASVAIARWQRVTQLRDRAAARQLERQREREREEHDEKIAGREKWQPEYQEIRQCLDDGEKLAYSVLDNGPCTLAELEALDRAAFAIRSKILAQRGIERLRDPLLGLAGRAEELRQHAMPDEVAADRLPDGVQYRTLLREAILQDRAATCLAADIRAARQVLREECGD